jgi:hypothetical protein
MAFLPENHPWTVVVTVILFVFFMIGLIKYSRGEFWERFFVLFFVLSLVTWMLLVIKGKLTFSPTRHTLMFLPLLIVFAVAGITRVGSCFGRFSKVIHPVLVVFILSSFLWAYPSFLKERKDPFEEKDIMDVLSQYQVDAIIQAQWTDQVEVMKGIRQMYGHKGGDFVPYVLISNSSTPYKRLAWISHREKINPDRFERARAYINRYLYYMNFLRQQRNEPVQAFLYNPHDAYRIIYAQQVDSDVETEISRRTHNGTNGFYFYILEHR